METSNPTERRPADSTADNPPQNVVYATPAQAILAHISENKIDAILCITRVLTILTTFSFLIGYPEPAYNRYKQALLLTGATSSLRLHQRNPPPQLNQFNRANAQTYLSNLFKEDAFHYLFFPIIFVFCQPISMVLLPCCLYALFNLARYAIQVLDKMGNQAQLKQTISNIMTQYQKSILQLIAISELTLAVVVIVGLVTKTVNIMTPMLFYRFLKFRYNSTRNAHLKLLVTQLSDIVSSYMNSRQS